MELIETEVYICNWCNVPCQPVSNHQYEVERMSLIPVVQRLSRSLSAVWFERQYKSTLQMLAMEITAKF